MCRITDSAGKDQLNDFLSTGMPERIARTVIYTTNKRKQRLAKEIASFNEINKNLLEENVEHANAALSAAESLAFLKSECDIGDLIGMEVVDHETLEFDESTEFDFGKGINEVVVENKSVADQQKELLQPLEQQQKKNNGIADILEKHNRNESSYDEISEKSQTDWLGQSTGVLKSFLESANSQYEKIQGSRIHTLLTRTTQPAHIILVCLMSVLLIIFWPKVFVNSKNEEEATSISKNTPSTAIGVFTMILYLGSFATHFGSQIWMTFVSGLSLYFSLPRHMFGECQKILFPKYFALSSGLNVAMLIIYVRYFMHNLNYSACIQAIALVTMTIIEAVVWLYLAPPMVRLMQEKYKIEYVVGSGQEIGTVAQGSLVRCPHYQRIHKAFRRIHMAVAIGNMIALMASCLHLYFLASKIQIN